MTEKEKKKINERIEMITEYKDMCHKAYTNSNSNEEVKSMHAGLNMAYGMELKFLNDLINKLV